MAERAAIQECDQELLSDRDEEARRTIAARIRFLADSSDGALSDTIVAERTDRHGVRTWPWLHPATRA